MNKINLICGVLILWGGITFLSYSEETPPKAPVPKIGHPIIFDDMLALFNNISDSQAKAIADSYFLNQQRKRGEENADNFALQDKIKQLKQQGQNLKKNLSQELTDFSSFIQYEWREDHPLHYLSAHWIENLQIELESFDYFADELKSLLAFLRKTRRPEEANCLEKYYVLVNGLEYLKKNLILHLSEYRNTPPSPLQYDLINDGLIFLRDYKDIQKKYTSCVQDAEIFLNNLRLKTRGKFAALSNLQPATFRAFSPSSLFSGE